MATQTVDFHPTDLIGQEERKAEDRRRRIAAYMRHREDLIGLLADRRFRARIRAELREDGLDVTSDDVNSTISPDLAWMCLQETRRVRALRTLWPILRLVASGHVPLETFQELMTEKDE